MTNLNEDKFLMSGDSRRIQKSQQTDTGEWEDFVQEVRHTLQSRPFGTAGASQSPGGANNWVAKEYLLRKVNGPS